MSLKRWVLFMFLKNSDKCNCLFMSVFFCVFYVYARILTENELFVIKVGFQIVVKVMVFLMFLKIVKTAILCGCPCCFVFHLSCLKNCLEKILQPFVLIETCEMMVIGVILCLNSFITNNCSLNWVFIECVAKGLDETWTFLWVNQVLKKLLKCLVSLMFFENGKKREWGTVGPCKS